MIFVCEAIQLVVGMIGLVNSLWNVWMAAEDAVDMAGTPGLTGITNTTKLLALRTVSRELVLMAANALLALIGIVGVLLPAPSEADPVRVIGRAVILISLSVLLAFDAVLERHSRLAFDAVVQKRQAGWTFRDSLFGWWRFRPVRVPIAAPGTSGARVGPPQTSKAPEPGS